MELLQLMGVHGTILVGSFTAWWRYGDRMEIQRKCLEGTDAIIVKLKSLISDGISKEFVEEFSRPFEPSNIIFPGDSEPMSTTRRPVVDSDRVRDIVLRHVDRRPDVIADYYELLKASKSWCCWAERLSWCILISLMVNTVCMIVLLALWFFANNGHLLVIQPLVPWCGGAMIGLASSIILAAIPCLTRGLCNQNTILRIHNKYHAHR